MRTKNTTNAHNERKLISSCGMAYTLYVIGGRWKPTILYRLLQGTMRYRDLKEKLPNVSERMLTLHLRKLERDGIVMRTVYPSVPLKVEYSLTEKGKTLSTILHLMSEWGEKNRN